MVFIFPDWPAPLSVRACSTTRCQGISLPPYDSLNLSDNVGDEPVRVAENRRLLVQSARLPEMPVWLRQVHGTDVLRLTDIQQSDIQADAVYSHFPGKVCAVMTADCLPVLFCSVYGDEVAAAHAGWRGLSAGILEQVIAQFSAPPSAILAWLGPAISVQCFQVGEEVKRIFTDRNSIYSSAFIPAGSNYFADIYLLARLRLKMAGISSIYGGHYCTVTDSQRFFSYRREGVTGRMASLIWLT